MSATKKPRTAQEQWEAVLQQAEGPEARELEAMSDEEIDAELRASGLDPERVAREGQALAEKAMREAGLLDAGSASGSESESGSGSESESASESGSAPASESAPGLARPRAVPLAASQPVEAQPADVFQFPPASSRVVRPARRRAWGVLLAAAAISAATVGTAITVARLDVPPPRKPIPEQPPVRPEPSPEVELAVRLRDDARTDYDNGRLVDCLAKLDHARALDPAGDATDSVQRMRADVQQWMTPRDAGPDKAERKRR